MTDLLPLWTILKNNNVHNCTCYHEIVLEYVLEMKHMYNCIKINL